MTQQHDDAAIRALVEADRFEPTAPDLAALRRSGRRRLIGRRAAIGTAVMAVVAAITIPVAVLTHEPDRVPPVVEQTTPPPVSPTPTKPVRPESVELPMPDGTNLVAETEPGTLQGQPLAIGRFGTYRQVVYAATGADGETYVSVGVRYRGQIVRTGNAIVPADAEPADGFVLYDGSRLDQYDDPHYLLVGVVEGDTQVSVAAPGGSPRTVTGQTSSMLPGYTVFFDRAPWDQTWDSNRLAPLTVSTADGRSGDVRKVSWVG